MSLHNRWTIDGGEDSDDDCRESGLTTSSYHRAAAAEGYRRADSWRTSQCRNPCLRPCLTFLKDSGKVVVVGREELDWVIKGIFRSFSYGSQATTRGRIDEVLAVAGQVAGNAKFD